jgi:catechol 2,3-dioxygenase-like lactoylglutathione lyase family enzyme
MWDHVGIRVSDREASRRFYELVLRVLGYEITHSSDHFDEWNDFGIAEASDEKPVTRHLHVAFVAHSRADVDAFWQAGVDAGCTSDGEPGPRPQYSESYYGGFLLDPDGNSAEAIHTDEPRPGDNLIDHLWIGVSDLVATKRFYEVIAPVLGVRIAHTRPERFHVVGGGRSFALVHDGRPPTEHLHLAFAAPDNATVDEFHRAAVAAGYEDNGPPGERPVYHAGYYGAFVRDPDGNNVEAVSHNRPSRP